MTAFGDSAWTPPPRSLLELRALVLASGNPALEMTCDCATVTAYEFDVAALRDPAEIPISCDGCQSVHWVTVTPRRPSEL